MTTFVITIKSLYTKGLITKQKVNDFYKTKKITEEEYHYILRKEGN